MSTGVDDFGLPIAFQADEEHSRHCARRGVAGDAAAGAGRRHTGTLDARLRRRDSVVLEVVRKHLFSQGPDNRHFEKNPFGINEASRTLTPRI